MLCIDFVVIKKEGGMIMRIDWKDVGKRAGKTFVQAFGAAVVVYPLFANYRILLQRYALVAETKSNIYRKI